MKILLQLWAESRDAVRSSIRSPPQNIVHSGSVARTPHEKEAGGAGDAVMTGAGRKEGRGRGRVLTSQRPIFSHCQKGLRQFVGRRGRSPLWEKDGSDGRRQWKVDGMGDGTDRWEISLSCCFSWTDRQTTKKEDPDKKMLCANLFPFSRPSEQRRVRRGTESVSNGASSNLGESSSS